MLKLQIGFFPSDLKNYNQIRTIDGFNDVGKYVTPYTYFLTPISLRVCTEYGL